MKLNYVDNILNEKRGYELTPYEFQLVAIKKAAESIVQKNKNKKYLLDLLSKMG